MKHNKRDLELEYALTSELNVECESVQRSGKNLLCAPKRTLLFKPKLLVLA